MRDRYGIIIQTEPNRPTYADGGDSAFSTGIMSMCTSIEDTLLMPKFIVGNKLVRHPHQAQHSTSDKTSRDQVIAFFSGLPYLLSYTSIYEKTFYRRALDTQRACLTYAKGYFVNKDILLPHVKMYLYKCAGKRPPLPLALLGYPFLLLMIIFDAFIKPTHEMNQSVCITYTMGRRWLKLLYKLHPDLIGNLEQYYVKEWRDKEFMFKEFKQLIERSVK